jgi:hypothetical protein
MNNPFFFHTVLRLRDSVHMSAASGAPADRPATRGKTYLKEQHSSSTGSTSAIHKKAANPPKLSAASTTGTLTTAGRPTSRRGPLLEQQHPTAGSTAAAQSYKPQQQQPQQRQPPPWQAAPLQEHPSAVSVSLSELDGLSSGSLSIEASSISIVSGANNCSKTAPQAQQQVWQRSVSGSGQPHACCRKPQTASELQLLLQTQLQGCQQLQ